MDLDDPLTGLDAVRPGIHAQSAADRTGNPVIEVKAAESGFQRERGQPLVRAGGARLKLRIGQLFRLAKTLGRKPDNDARNSAVTHGKVRADPDDAHRHLFGERCEKGCEIIRIGGHEHDLGRATHTKPRHLVHAGLLGEASSHVLEPVAELIEQGRLSIRHRQRSLPRSLARSLGSA